MTEEARNLVELLRDEDNCNVLDYIDDAADLIESLSAQLDQVTRERDAAIRDLCGYCGVCIYKTLPNTYEFCRNCKHSNRHYFTNEPALDSWQWRGADVCSERGLRKNASESLRNRI